MIRPAALAPAALALAALSAAGPAGALEAEPIRHDYAVTLAGIPIGGARLTLKGPPGRYTVRLDGDWRFFFWSGAAALASEGRTERALAPEAHQARFESPSRVLLADISFGPGAPRADFRAEPPFDADGEAEEPRVPILPEHLPGSADPLSAFLISAGSGAEACSGVRRVFSGMIRFDVALRPDGAAAAQGAGQGIVPCAGDYRPVSGHRVESAAVDRLRLAGLDFGFFEIAPGLWAPHRVALPTGFGELAFERRPEPAR